GSSDLHERGGGRARIPGRTHRGHGSLHRGDRRRAPHPQGLPPPGDPVVRPVLQVIVASTRKGRQGPVVGAWFLEQARAHDRFEIELVDLAEVNLPLLDEPAHPRLAQYEHEHTKAWSRTISRADAFVFVTPEYDFGPPASLINA